MALFADQPGDEGLPGHERRLAVIALMTSTTMTVFDGAMINIALPQIARSLDVSSAAAVWVANGYLLSTAMTLAVFAALAARTGFRALFAAGLALFTLASLGCALSTSLPVLVAMRVLQGIGGAATLSIAPAILRTIFPGRLLGRILGINALLIAANTAIAPAVGGALLSALSWPWLFAVNLPFGLFALLLTLRVIPGERAQPRGPFDFAGAVWSALALGAVILAANALSGHGAQGAQALLMPAAYGAVALIAALAFVRRQRRAPDPLLPPALFASPRFTLAALTSFSSFISQGMTFIALPFLFQHVYGYNAFTSALLFISWPVGIVLVAPHAGRLADRYPPARLATFGLALFAVGLMLLALLPDEPQRWDISLRGLVCGIGFGCFQSPNNREMLGSVARELSGPAGGILAIMRTFGQCTGAAILGVMLTLQTQHGEESAIRLGLWIATATTILAVMFSASRLRLRAR